jgi:hypothetical protein
MNYNINKNNGYLWIIIGISLILVVIIIGYFLNQPIEDSQTQQSDVKKVSENDLKQRQIDSLEKENKKRENELQAIKRKEKEEEKKVQEEKEKTVKFSGFGGNWVDICSDASGTKYYIADEEIRVFKYNNYDHFYGHYLNVYSSSSYPTDNSIIAQSGQIEFNINERTSAFINYNTFYAGKPSKYGYSDMKEESISKGSVIDLLFEAFIKKIKK